MRSCGRDSLHPCWRAECPQCDYVGPWRFGVNSERLAQEDIDAHLYASVSWGIPDTVPSEWSL